MLISKVNNGDIFYVSDVTDYKEASSAPNSVSNYFICINVDEIGNIEKGFIPCLATNVFQTEGFLKEDFPNIVVPKKSYLSAGFGNEL